MIFRKSNWASLLEQFLAANRGAPFSYGRWDCCLFVADAIAAMTGVDIAAQFRGWYSSAREARQLGTVRAIAEVVAESHGMPEVAVRKASRGDMVLIRRPRDYSLGIVALNGSEILIALKVGFGAVPLDRGCRAWHV